MTVSAWAIFLKNIFLLMVCFKKVTITKQLSNFHCVGTYLITIL